jgi:hypothetical protein
MNVQGAHEIKRQVRWIFPGNQPNFMRHDVPVYNLDVRHHRLLRPTQGQW